jgi:FdhD protein
MNRFGGIYLFIKPGFIFCMKVLRVNSCESSNFFEDNVVKDILFCIFLDGIILSRLMIYEQYLEELVIGHLITRTVIQSVEEIKEIKLDERSAHVLLHKKSENKLGMKKKFEIIEKASNSEELVLSKNNGLPSVDSKTIFEIMMELNKRGDIFKSTGGTHSAIIWQENLDIVFVEDVGRLNAIDKAVGSAILNGFNLNESIICTSGRLSGEMVLKAAFAGIPIICSVSAPLHTGIQIAEASDMTLIGFAREKRFNVYTGFRRFSI